MNNTERVTGLRPTHTINGQGGEMAFTLDAEAAAQLRRESLPITPAPVSRSSYLYETDRYYRAAVTVDGTGDLGRRAIKAIVGTDREAQEAAVNGSSQRAQASIERMIDVVGHTTGLVVFDYGSANQG